MIENPLDYDGPSEPCGDLSNAPVGAGEPLPDGLSPAEALYGFAGWLSCLSNTVTFGAMHEASTAAELVEAYRLAQGLEAPRDGWHLKLKPVPDLSRRANPLSEIVAKLLAPGADLFAITGMPRDLEDDRVSEPVLFYSGTTSEGAVALLVRTTVAGKDFMSTIELDPAALPMPQAFRRGAARAIREQVLQRAGLMSGDPTDDIELSVDSAGNVRPVDRTFDGTSIDSPDTNF